MPDSQISREQLFSKTISIAAPTERVWEILTEPVLMQQWMSEMELEITVDWKVGSDLLIRGALYKKPFENKGVVLKFLPTKELEYTHLSSISRLPDVPESYTRISFSLQPVDGKTELTLKLSNFANEVIYKHLAFYWNVTLELLKRFAEGGQGIK